MMIPFPLGQEKRSPPLSPNHSPLSPTRIVRSKPAEPPAEADAVPVATVVVPVKAEEGERFPSNPQVGVEDLWEWEMLKVTVRLV